MGQSFKKLPSVDSILSEKSVKKAIEAYGRDQVLFSARNVLESYRNGIKSGDLSVSAENLISDILNYLGQLTSKSLKKVCNATGIIINTNLGRAPFGETLINDTFEVLKGYNNLEFDLEKAGRGQRTTHAKKIIKYLTGAEDVLVVNNNAAAVMLILRCFAKRREVIISRGELIEIGGSFRIPDIMKASDCKMIEIGTTNKTSISDYRNAISEKTGLIFKTHKSNYIIKGFTHEVEIQDIVKIGKEKNIPVVYDLGSGLLRKVEKGGLHKEPDVRESVKSGADLICFSGDKLLGGPQAGIIAGKKELIRKLEKEPMYRALRVCKISLAFLETACSYYYTDKNLFEKNLLFRTIMTPDSELKKYAVCLSKSLNKYSISTSVKRSKGYFGGGTMPETEIDSYSVSVNFPGSGREQVKSAELMYHELMKQRIPIVAILKKGELHLDVLTMLDETAEEIAEITTQAYNCSITSKKRQK